jgi:hypothetical protein
VGCNYNSGCKVKIAEPNDDGSGCYGTVLVGCGGELKFYYGPDGSYEYSVNGRRRRRRLDLAKTTDAEEEEEAKAEVEGALSSSSLEAIGSDVADGAPSLGEGSSSSSSSSNSSLRGGAKKESKTIDHS